MKGLFDFIQEKTEKKSFRFYRILIIILLIIYFSIIVFGFVNLSGKIEESGFSTEDLQNATSREKVIVIVNALQPYIKYVNILYIFDYLFIATGLILFFSLNALLLKYFKNNEKLQYLPKFGLIITIFSRTFDALENLFTIIIYLNPTSFPLFLLTFLRVTSMIKWIFVVIEYTIMIISWIIVLILKFKSK